MASKYTISTVFKGVDRMTRPVGKMTNSISNMTEKTEAGLRKIDNATSALSSSLLGVGKKAAAGIGIITTTALAGSAAINKQTVETEKLIKAQELSAETVGAITHALKGTGLGAENVLDLAEEMRNAFGESAGLEEITKVTESLGIMGLQFRDIKKLSPEDQFKTITKTLLNMESATEASAAADILFGSEGNKIVGILRQQEKGLGGVIQDYKMLNFFTDKGREGASKYVDELSKTETIFGSIGKEISGLIGLHLSPLMAKFNEFLIANKSVIQTGLDSFFEKLAQKIGSLSEYADEASDFILNLGVNFEKFMTYAKWVGGFIVTLSGMSLVLKTLTVITTAFNLAMAANPLVWIIGGIVAAVGALGYAVYQVYQNWDSITEYFSNLWDSVKTTFNIGMEFIKSAFDWNPIDAVSAKWDGLKGYFSNLFSGIVDLYGNTIGAVMSGIDSVTSSVGGFFGFGDDESTSQPIRVEETASPQQRAQVAMSETISRTISESRETVDINVTGQNGAQVSSPMQSPRLNLINTAN